MESVRVRSPEVVLSDVHLSRTGMDGVELTRRIRADEKTGRRLIVLLTGCKKQETLLRCLAAGADDFLLKPFHPPEMLARLRSHLRLIKWRRLITLNELAARSSEAAGQLSCCDSQEEPRTSGAAGSLGAGRQERYFLALLLPKPRRVPLARRA